MKDFDATITRAVVVQDEITKDTVLMGAIERMDDIVNFKVPFNYEELEGDHHEFMDALKDKLAEELACPPRYIMLNEELLLKRMIYYGKQIELGRLN